VLEIVKGPGERFRYFDGGQNELTQSRRQLAALERELKTVSDPAARAMRVERQTTLQAAIKTLENDPPKPPAEKHIRYATTAITKSMKEDPLVLQKVKAYNETLCALSAKATADIPCKDAGPGGARYLGSETCGACHAAALAQWKTQKHAHAVKTLEDAGKLCDLGCIGCHTTGFDKPGGFCSPQKVGALKEVGCENCHGPGSRHVQKGDKAAVVRSPGKDVCLSCHTKEHSDLFDFDVYLKRIIGPGHGQPSP
jgi:Cytochrome c554 and c-prime